MTPEQTDMAVEIGYIYGKINTILARYSSLFEYPHTVGTNPTNVCLNFTADLVRDGNGTVYATSARND